ncbi:sulfurtransferase/chromate resistance protein [Labrenzia sp. PHM005]|uniref:chromate resistance protein ChrB domain-containing protein n=1 Tax=Labrenzia sp. PHM005 TaxID=2590016 RepID=UPI00114025EF|nr:sulfurtransferase/chromate resistance protein [Labrenzia sp. PHM005]QDG79042.1 sulfurtransferase [Labrenzia sp. PHM005]
MPAPNQITPLQLSRLIGTPECPVLVDVRIDEDYQEDPYLIPGSFRHSYLDIDGLAAKIGGQKCVVICQKGKKLSEGVSAWLRHEGLDAEVLQGGVFGWRDANLPRLDCKHLPNPDAQGRTVWVTRLRPKVDRIACPWLIRRFIDPYAVFLFTAKQEVPAVVERFDATPFDLEDVFWSHRGEKCTFDTMVEEFGLTFEPLLHLARVVRGADTERLDLEPQCSGLLAASLGLSRMYRDDLALLDAAMPLYDAFYRWSRDAREETHDWPADRGTK